MTKIVFLDRETIGPDIELSKPSGAHEWTEYAATPPEEVVARLKGATIAVTNKVPIRRESLDQLPDLKFITVAATGYDVIDIEACRERGIPVSNVRGYAVNTVPDHAMALILALSRSLPGYRQDVIDGAWQTAGQFCFFNHPIFDLANRKIGIIGEGIIGQGVARRAEAFGMSVMFAAHKGVDGLGPLYTPFDEVIETADIITLHAPLTPRTRNVIAMPEFERMRKKPLIINTSRGGLVDEADLVKALDRGLISGFGFDVLTKEPPAADNPLLTVLDRPNVIVTPHVAWASNEAMGEVWRQVIDSIDRFVTGDPVRRVV
ncbi:D-2-hydroxyacid dehydrogenase [Jiella sp. MQZ9-1]|uniref:D-2-hydroxyacid dehydrogenase n=1 Tax=Jiella flava TaxID=2816857 RepID=A0A939G3G6_9HYPH|nr:D-2-hydroxyacid dehydrogenase [Jiella flava]MBO0664379.1 D-2-hydroxyacid dehydrogenase [Jiella flava]MCD2473014.1 D-2-hydroxyacid dehydrogenase [Jiella flava]